MGDFMYNLLVIMGIIVAGAMILMYIPLPLVLIICLVGGAIMGWKYEGRKLEEEERPKHPVDYMTDEEKQRMYDEWRNKK